MNATHIGFERENWYDHVTKSVKTSHEGKVTILWNQQVRTYKLFLTINRTS